MKRPARRPSLTIVERFRDNRESVEVIALSLWHEKQPRTFADYERCWVVVNREIRKALGREQRG